MDLTLHTSTDEDLVRLLKADDENAFKELFLRYRMRLYIEANQKLDSEADANDIVQEVFIRLWQKRSSLYLTSTLKSYLLQAVRYECIDVIRSRNRTEERHQQYAYIKERIALNDPIENLELGRQLQTAINEIAPSSRAAFRMMYVENKSLKEIASHMGLSVSTVKNHIGNALKRLRKKLEKVK